MTSTVSMTHLASMETSGFCRAFASAPCSHAFVGSAEIRGMECGRVHQRQKRHPSGFTGLRAFYGDGVDGAPTGIDVCQDALSDPSEGSRP
jgi:hypothetical protein